jgi:RNA polymerase sigma-70 factor (ECF subfamily)
MLRTGTTRRTAAAASLAPAASERDRDLRIIAGVAARSEAGLREAIDLHGAAVNGIARKVLVDAHRAEEITQDTFLTLWNDHSRFDAERGSLRAYLVRIGRNKAIDLVRKEQARADARSRLEESGVIPDLGSAAPAPNVEDRLDLVSALRELTGLQREALALAYFGGRTYAEVAAELGIPVGTAKTRLRDGLTALRKTLGRGSVPAHLILGDL